MKKIWIFLYSLIPKHMPISNYKLSFGSKYIRRWFAKRIITKCGKNVNIEKGATFSDKLEIGDNSGLGINSMISPYVKIGKNVMMGPEVYIYTRNHEFSNINIPMIEQGFQEIKPVTIGDDVWIGSRVTILPGVKIGNGVVIGASTVITKDVPDYSVFCGNPGKVMKYRKNREEN